MTKFRVRRKSESSHIAIKLSDLSIPNAPPDEFVETCKGIPLLGYRVETLSDGTSVCITKPGGKTFSDFQVWAVAPDGTAFRPSHVGIRKDIVGKFAENQGAAGELIKALGRVCRGEEPDDVLRDLPKESEALSGYPADLILKVYKWIFAQEDCNYPPPKFQGRMMAMSALEELLAK